MSDTDVRLTGKVVGDEDTVEQCGDRLMVALLDCDGITDPAVSCNLATGEIEVEFVLEEA